MNLSIIIPNYNGAILLKKNLPAVLDAISDYNDGSIEVIIPDDPSTDNSEEVIKEFIAISKTRNIESKTVRNNDENEAGFSKNVNRGVEIATGDILILLNSDVKPHKDFLNTLLPHFADKDVFAVGCLDESIEANRKVLRGRGVGRWEKGFLQHQKGDIERNNTLWASGGSSAFNRKIWDKIGGLEELYNPFYWEDNDISYRALKDGYKVIFEKNSRVIHEHETGTIKSLINKTKIKKIAYRNQFIFVWLNITDKSLLLSHIVWIPFHLVTALKRKDWYFYFGFVLGLKRIKQILKKRKKYTKLRIKTDKEILDQFKE